jgi:hypothetical protein
MERGAKSNIFRKMAAQRRTSPQAHKSLSQKSRKSNDLSYEKIWNPPHGDWGF